jgi:WD40 repeat protein
MRAMRTPRLATISLLALAASCGGDAPPAIGPADLTKADPGVSSGRVRKSPFECDDAPTAIASPPASTTAPPTPSSARSTSSGIAFDPRAVRFAHWTRGLLVVRSASDGASLWRGSGSGAVFRDDGTQLAAFEEGAIVARDLPSGAEALRATTSGDALAAAWSDDGKRLWVIDGASPIPLSAVYDVPTRTQCRGSYALSQGTTAVVISPDRTRAVRTWSGDPRGTPTNAAVVVLVQGSPDERLPLARGSLDDSGFAFSRTGLVIAARGASGVFTWNARTAARGDAMADSLGASAVALSDDGAYLAAIVGVRVRVWDARTTTLVRDLTLATGAPVAIAFFPARTRVAIATDGGVEAFDALTGAVVWSRSER